MIYVPEDNTFNACYVVQSENTIRAYDTTPRVNTSYNYRDYYIRSDYVYRDGSGSWGQYATLPVCLDSNKITHEDYYRLDYYKSLIIVLIVSIFAFYIPIKVFSRIFKKGVL